MHPIHARAHSAHLRARKAANKARDLAPHTFGTADAHAYAKSAADLARYVGEAVAHGRLDYAESCATAAERAADSADRIVERLQFVRAEPAGA